MKLRFLLFIFALSLLALPAMAAEPAFLFSKEIYDQMKPGATVDKIWVSPDYDKGKGVKYAGVEWKADRRNASAKEYLVTSVKGECRDNGAYDLTVWVVSYYEGIMTWDATFLGRIQTPDGKVVATFMQKNSAPKKDANKIIDKAISAIAKELF